MWGLWWTKWHWDRFSPSTSVSPAIHSTNFSIIIFTGGWHSRPIGGRSAGWTQWTPSPTIPIRKKNLPHFLLTNPRVTRLKYDLRLTHKIYHALDNKEYCTSTFLDATQAFDKVWHPGLLYKIQKFLPDIYYPILKSYLYDREFRIRINDTTSKNYAIKSGVP
jgi:hypothetical protein